MKMYGFTAHLLLAAPEEVAVEELRVCGGIAAIRRER